ncbi:MAG: UvrD-helicase domain-containing protein [Candidatus Accumulibacter sp.]|jgi:ATP-dependent DNA helicase Rep|nr:UvrD-helicase domain-containing protein [Accumulibacter sp.]
MSVPLNPSQREAIRYLDGPLLVLAGAGSGKTRVITRKIVYLIRECGFNPGNIAAITFTNKAAREMQERVAHLLGEKPAGLLISTFHSLGARILREEARTLGYKPRFSIFDATDCYGVLAELSGGVDKATIRRLQALISGWKNAQLTPDQAMKLAGLGVEQLAAQTYASYAATLKAYQAVDFDDLIALPVELFRAHPQVLDKWQNRLRYLLIDEYQDTNASQYQMLRLLAGPRAAFTAVGDDDQAIYGWRGADIENLRGLPRDYPKLKLIKLEQNYRSTARILKAANSLIAHNEKMFDKKLWSELGQGDPISVMACRDNEKEAEQVTMKLQAHRFEHRAKFSDYAILYRGNFQARALEQQLRDQRVPYQLSGGQSFFDKAEIKDITAYLRLLANNDDDPAFIRAVTTPRRGVGGVTLEALGQYAGERRLSLFAAAAEEGFAHRAQPRQLAPLAEFQRFIGRFAQRAASEPAGQVIEDLLTAIGYEAWLHGEEEKRVARTRWENVRELADWLTRKGDEEKKTLLELIQVIALINLIDRQEDGNRPDAVQLSTLHAAKGLEFRHVFLIGVEEGVLPHRESLDAAKLEEERRLMYVGITRAQHSLHVSYAEKRRQGRKLIPSEPSRFIAEMGSDLRFSGGKTDATPDKATGAARLNALRAMLNGGRGTPGG